MDNKIKYKRITLEGLDKTASGVNTTYVKVDELKSILDNITVSTGEDIAIIFPDIKRGNEYILHNKSIPINLNPYHDIIVLNSGDYDADLKPTIASEQINSNAIYLVPIIKTGVIERYVMWIYRGGDWIEISSTPISSSEINDIIGEN